MFYRCLGNDLPPLRPVGSIATQLRFILEHEAELPGLEKRWLLHHITDPQQRQTLIDQLERHGQSWQELPFDALGYAACWTDLGDIPPTKHPWGQVFEELNGDEQSQILYYIARQKSLYLFNDNAASNHALRLGWDAAAWVFVADSSCFLTAEAWQVIQPLLEVPDLAYLAVPTATLANSQQLLQPLDQPPLPDGLPLLGFARSGREPFKPALRQGAGADTDLLRRLGLAGPWQQHPDLGSWEATDSSPLPDRARLVQAGWAYRLPPQAQADRQQQREAIRRLARRTDMRLIGEALQKHRLRCWIGLGGANAATPGLASIAANARAVPPLSVSDKPEPVPGTQARSYVNAVPHWQGLAGSESALDRSLLLAQNGPACGDVAQHYDRARLQLMIDCVCALALDGHLNGNGESLDHAHRLVRTWFIDPATAMIPDGAYARLSAVDPSRNVLDAALDFRDLYPLLDAVGLLQRSGRLSSAETQQLEDWFDAFLAWLADGSGAFLRDNSGSPACTWYHLLMLAIAAFRGRRNVAAQVFDNLPGLLARQYCRNGSPSSASLGRALRHEHLFNLQAWANLVVLSSALGRDLLALTDSKGIGLRAAFAYAANHLPHEPAAADLSSADWMAALRAICFAEAGPGAPSIPPLPEASTGLPPFWNLCRPVALE